MNTKQLRQKVLDLAIHGKLVPQCPDDEPASVLLKRIQDEKAALVKAGKLKKKDLETTPVSDEDKPFELPEGWEWCRLGEIAFVTKLAGFEYTNYIADNLSPTNGVPLFKGKNIKEGTIIYEFESFIPGSVSEDLFRSQVYGPCLLTPYVGAIGNIGYHNIKGKFHLGSNVGKIEVLWNNDQVDLIYKYIVQFLRSKQGFKQLSKYKKATAQESISIQAIRDVFIPLPPLAEQQRIVAAVEQWMSLIDVIESGEKNLQQSIALAKNKILDLAIRGKLVKQYPADEPASALLQRIRKEKEQLVKEGKLKKKDLETTPIADDEKPFELPEGWEWCRLGEIYTMQAGKSISASELSIEQNDVHPYPCYGGNGLRGYIGRFNEEGVHCLIGRQGALCGNVNLSCGGKFQATEHAVVVSHSLSIDVYWSYWFLIALNLNQYATATAQPGLSVGNILTTLIPLPPLSEQHRIVAKIEELFAQLDEIEKSLN